MDNVKLLKKLNEQKSLFYDEIDSSRGFHICRILYDIKKFYDSIIWVNLMDDLVRCLTSNN